MKNPFINPFSDNFNEIWELWKQYKAEQWKFKYKSSITEQGAMKDLVDLSGGSEEIATKIVNQSISHGWRGFHPLKVININQNGAKQANSQTATRQSLNELYNQRFGTGR